MSDNRLPVATNRIEGETPLSRLARGAEEATEAFATSVDAASEAEADYLRAFHVAKAHCDESWSETRKSNHAETVAFQQKIALKRAEWAVERAKAVMRTRLAVLSAAQSHIRSIEKQGG